MRALMAPDHDYSLCLFAGNWGVIALQLLPLSDTSWSLPAGSVEPVFIEHILSSQEVQVIPVRGVFRDTQIVLEADGPPVTLIRSALNRRRTFTVWELKHCLISFGEVDPRGEHNVLLHRLIDHECGDDEEAAQASQIDV